jgi:hypothetical protein
MPAGCALWLAVAHEIAVAYLALVFPIGVALFA